MSKDTFNEGGYVEVELQKDNVYEEGEIEIPGYGKIKTISFKRVVSTGNYENIQLEASTELMDGDSPELSVSNLVRFVDSKLASLARKNVGTVSVKSREIRDITFSDPFDDEYIYGE